MDKETESEPASPAGAAGPAGADPGGDGVGVSALRRGILNYSAAAILVVGLLIAAATAWPLYGVMVGKEQASLLANHRLLDLSLDQYSANFESLTAQVTSRTRIREELAAYNRGEISAGALAAFSRPKLADALHHDRMLAGVLRFDARGQPVVAAGCPVPLAAAPTGVEQVTHLGVRQVGGEACLLVAAPIRAPDGTRVGTDVAGFRTADLARLMHEREPLAQTVSAVVLAEGAQGTPVILARADAVALGMTDARLATALARLPAGAGVALTGARLPEAGEVLVSHSVVGGAGWRLFVVHSKEAIYAPVVRQLARVGGLSLLLAVAGLLGMRRLLRPLTGKLLIHAATLDQEVRDKTAALRAELAERARTEAALRRSEARLEQAQEIAGLGSWEVDAGGRVTASAEACRLFGIPPVEAAGGLARLHAHVHPDDRARVAGVLEQGVARREPYDIEYRIAAPEAPERVVRERAEPLSGSDEAHLGMLGTLQDVTADREAQSQRRRLEAELQSGRRLEAIGRLANGIAHDFNNILAGILGYSELALTRCSDELSPRLREYLAEIRTAGERGRDVVAQLSTFSRGSTRERREAVLLQQVVPEALRILRPTLPATLAVEVEIAERLAPALADPVQVQQALMNLCLNARDAMEGRGRLRIVGEESACHQAPEGGQGFQSRHWIELRVEDSGPGIAAEQLERIFEPFYSTKEVGKGTGLGLSVVHGIMRSHGGHVLVESEPERGTRVRLLFPRREDGDEGTVLEDAALPPPTGRRQQILVVDDEPAVARYLGEVLALLGYRARVETSSAAAAAVLTADPDAWDALVTDQTMPGMTGTELIAAARRLRPGLPALLCSGHVTTAPPASDGSILFLPKPVTGRELAEALGRLLGDGPGADEADEHGGSRQARGGAG